MTFSGFVLGDFEGPDADLPSLSDFEGLEDFLGPLTGLEEDDMSREKMGTGGRRS